jgi:hypothetical protein
MRVFALFFIARMLSAGTLILLTPEDAVRMKSRHSAPFEAILRHRADAALSTGPWTVTASRPASLKLPPNEYYSEAPYYWPDPAHPGQMIRKDGERNPDRFDGNHQDIGIMSNAVLALGAGAYFFDDERYARKAAEDIAVWFENPATRMNPDLQHAQAVTGANDGRPTGIIDTVNLIHCAQGIALLEASGKWEAGHAAAARKWFAEYLTWLRTSANGKAEARSGNNHATWWTAQVSAFASLTSDEPAKKEAWAWFRSELLKQIQPNGACPREEDRTTSLHYSCYDLDAFATLCRIAQTSGVDLWKSGDLPKAFLYIAPYVIDPGSWKKQQIKPFKESPIFVGLAASALQSPELRAIREKMRDPEDVWSALADTIAASK